MNDISHNTEEQRLIDAIKSWTGERLIGDDCAVLPGGQLVTVDALIEGTHFVIPGISFPDLGWKSLAVNLSDIAAMSGRPRYAVVSLNLPPRIRHADLERFYSGLMDCARAYRCRIVGGNLARSAEMAVTITVLADAHECGVMTRSGARDGDVVIASGDFGASAAGLWLMKNAAADFTYCRQRHFRPLPRLCESWSLVRQTRGAGALMDASDGLGDALVQLAAASCVGIEIEETSIPIDKETRAVAERAGVEPLHWALYGGEDYELVAAIRPGDWEVLKKAPYCAFTEIGKVSSSAKGVFVLSKNGSRSEVSLANAFQHWT